MILTTNYIPMEDFSSEKEPVEFSHCTGDKILGIANSGKLVHGSVKLRSFSRLNSKKYYTLCELGSSWYNICDSKLVRSFDEELFRRLEIFQSRITDLKEKKSLLEKEICDVSKDMRNFLENS